MSGANGWRIPQDFETQQRHLEKRLMNEERRPAVTRASDLLGPGAGPYAVQVFDWNSDDAAFVGVYYSSPDEGQSNSPDDAKHWIGETFGTAGGYGFQRATEVYTQPPGTPSPNVQIRHFYSATGQRLYTDWQPQ